MRLLCSEKKKLFQDTIDEVENKYLGRKKQNEEHHKNKGYFQKVSDRIFTAAIRGVGLEQHEKKFDNIAAQQGII